MSQSATLPPRLSDAAHQGSGLPDAELERLAGVARRAAEAGAAELRRHFGQLEQIREKGRAGDLVTEADVAAERAVLAVLEAETPDLGVLAEESGRRAGAARAPSSGCPRQVRPIEVPKKG